MVEAKKKWIYFESEDKTKSVNNNKTTSIMIINRYVLSLIE